MERMIQSLRRISGMAFLLYILIFANYLLHMSGVLNVGINPSSNADLRERIGQVATTNLTDMESAEYDGSVVDQVDESAYADSQTRFDDTIQHNGIGFIGMPSVDIYLPVLAGMSHDNLLTGVGTYRPDRELGVDNYVVLSHSLIEDTSNRLLNHLNQVEVGDVMHVTDYENVYTFEVHDNHSIHETETQYIANTYDNPMLTVFRCHGTYGTDYRQLVQAELVEQRTIDDTDEEIRVMLGLGSWVDEPNMDHEPTDTDEQTIDVVEQKEQKEQNKDLTDIALDEMNVFERLSYQAYVLVAANYSLFIIVALSIMALYIAILLIF